MCSGKNESKKPATSPIVAGVDQEIKAPWGMCPVMSTWDALVINPGRGQGQVSLLSSPQIVNIKSEAPCIGPRCQWWIPEWESCCVRGIATIREIAAALKPTSWKENLKLSESDTERVELYLNKKINKMMAEIERLSAIVDKGGNGE